MKRAALNPVCLHSPRVHVQVYCEAPGDSSLVVLSWGRAMLQDWPLDQYWCSTQTSLYTVSIHEKYWWQFVIMCWWKFIIYSRSVAACSFGHLDDNNTLSIIRHKTYINMTGDKHLHRKHIGPKLNGVTQAWGLYVTGTLKKQYRTHAWESFQHSKLLSNYEYLLGCSFKDQDLSHEECGSPNWKYYFYMCNNGRREGHKWIAKPKDR